MFWEATSIARCAALSPLTAVLNPDSPVTTPSQRSVDDDGTAGTGDGLAAPPGVVALRAGADPAAQLGERLLDRGQPGGGHAAAGFGQHPEFAADRDQRVAVLDQHLGPGRLSGRGQILQGGPDRQPELP